MSEKPLVLDGWKIHYGIEGWKHPPVGCAPPMERHFAQWLENHSVTAWLENGHLHVRDDEAYYPDGCYWVPLSVVSFLKKRLPK